MRQSIPIRILRRLCAIGRKVIVQSCSRSEAIVHHIPVSIHVPVSVFISASIVQSLIVYLIIVSLCRCVRLISIRIIIIVASVVIVVTWIHCSVVVCERLGIRVVVIIVIDGFHSGWWRMYWFNGSRDVVLCLSWLMDLFWSMIVIGPEFRIFGVLLGFGLLIPAEYEAAAIELCQ